MSSECFLFNAFALMKKNDRLNLYTRFFSKSTNFLNYLSQRFSMDEKKRINIVFSDNSDSSSSNEIPILQSQSMSKDTNNLPQPDNSPNLNDNSPLQSTSPFEISSSDEYSEPNQGNKIQPTSSPLSSLERFYYDDETDNPRLNPFRYITYMFAYTKKKSVKGTRYHYQLIQGGQPLFHSKSKSKHSARSIPISSGVECHFSQNSFAGVLSVDQKKHIFSLHEEFLDGKELMTVQFEPANGEMPRNIKATFHDFPEPNTSPQKLIDLLLISRKPEKNSSGQWTLSFGGKYVIPSVKNCILVQEGRDNAMISTRRISSTACEVEVLDSFSPLALFGFLLSVFVSNL